MSTKRNIPTSYAEADALLGTRDTLNICNNTRLERNGYRGGRAVALRLHSTLVVVWYENGDTELRTGGWNTVTTRDRINRALKGTPWSVGTERGTVYLYRHATTWDRTDCHETVCVCHDDTAPAYDCSGCGCWARWAEGARYAWRALTDDARYVRAHHAVTLYADGTTNAQAKPRRHHTPHTNPACACAACVAKREGWRGIARMQGRRTWEYEPAAPEDHYGASEADGAACRAMANALAAIQRERAPRPEGVPA